MKNTGYRTIAKYVKFTIKYAKGAKGAKGVLVWLV